MADDEQDFAFPPAIAAGLALAVSVLAAVGLTGGTLTRAIRNDPGRIAWILTVIVVVSAVVGIVFVLSRGDRRPKNWLSATAIVVIAVALGALIRSGSESVKEREFPALALSVVSSDGRSEVTVEASGSSLKTDEDMLVQLVGVRGATPGRSACESSRRPTDEEPIVLSPSPSGVAEADGEEDPTYPINDPRPKDHPYWGTKVLLWQQVGPDQDGKVSATSSVVVVEGSFQFVCGFVSLRSDPGEDARSVAGYVVLPPGPVTDRRATAPED